MCSWRSPDGASIPIHRRISMASLQLLLNRCCWCCYLINLFIHLIPCLILCVPLYLSSQISRLPCVYSVNPNRLILINFFCFCKLFWISLKFFFSLMTFAAANLPLCVSNSCFLSFLYLPSNRDSLMHELTNNDNL